MLRRTLTQTSPWSNRAVCLFCAAQSQTSQSQFRSFNATGPLLKRKKLSRKIAKDKDAGIVVDEGAETSDASTIALGEAQDKQELVPTIRKQRTSDKDTERASTKRRSSGKSEKKKGKPDKSADAEAPLSLKEALLRQNGLKNASAEHKKARAGQLNIEIMHPIDLNFEAVEKQIPPVPMLSYGLDRVLFNPGVYLLQDPRSRIYNFDPYLEKVMPVDEFNFDALSEYKTSSKDTELLNLTSQLGTKFTGSTSSMSGVLQHFHYLLSNFRELDHDMLSRAFPDKTRKFSKISHRPNAIFLRYKNGIYAIDADKSYDTPNIMSWLGHSLEKLLTSDRGEFELYRRSNTEKAPSEDDSSRCYHYSKMGNLLMRSQLDAYDPRLPGSGVFDLKTRAVVSIRMNASEYEAGSGYQLRYAQGEWESYEREFYDMTRATMLKYSLQVRMGRMDGIFVAYHNIERIFGFQYLSLPDLDRVLHGQSDTSLGDQEFKLSLGLLDELLVKAINKFPETSIRLHVEARDNKTPFMYIFAEPVTEEEADEIQGAGDAAQKDFARKVVGIKRSDTDEEAWQSMQENVDEQLDKDSDERLETGQIDDGTSSATTEFAPTPEAIEDQTEGTATEEGSKEEETNEEDKAQEESPDVASDEAKVEENKPLIGWTLTIRSKVNGGYVDRPARLNADDDWKIEYNIQEIPKKSLWRVYDQLKQRRRGLSVMEGKEVDAGLQAYRNLIQRYSDRGRKWRNEQDKLNADKGVEMYKPLGPGSEAAEKESGAVML